MIEMHMIPERQRGFTLVELMVTVTIIAILSRIAYLSYTKQTIKGNRSAAEAQLVQMAQAEERWYATHDTYSSSASSLGYTQSPPNGTAIYSLAVNSASNTAYTLIADPSTPAQLNKTDGKLKLDSTGKKTWDSANDGSYSSTW